MKQTGHRRSRIKQYYHIPSLQGGSESCLHRLVCASGYEPSSTPCANPSLAPLLANLFPPLSIEQPVCGIRIALRNIPAKETVERRVKIISRSSVDFTLPVMCEKGRREKEKAQAWRETERSGFFISSLSRKTHKGLGNLHLFDLCSSCVFTGDRKTRLRILACKDPSACALPPLTL